MVVCTDEDFDRRILVGLERRWPEFEPRRAVEAGLAGREDPEVLDWAARERLVLLTQDARTMPLHALERLRRGLPMSGVVVVPQTLPLGRVIDELEFLLRTTTPEELEDRVVRLPL